MDFLHFIKNFFIPKARNDENTKEKKNFVLSNFRVFVIIVVVKKTFRYSNVFSYNHLYQPECFYEKRYNPFSFRLVRVRVYSGS